MRKLTNSQQSSSADTFLQLTENNAHYGVACPETHHDIADHMESQGTGHKCLWVESVHGRMGKKDEKGKNT